MTDSRTWWSRGAGGGVANSAGVGSSWLVLMLVLVHWCTLTRAVPVVRTAAAVNNETYWQQREALMEQDHSNMIGSSLVLSPAEELVNKLLTTALQAEMEDGFDNLHFPPSINFMLSKPDIEISQVFGIIKSMPKGAALHTHDTALTSVDFVIREITYWDDLYMCYGDGVLLFRFSSTVPSQSCSDSWQLVADERAAYSSPQEFDAFLYQLMTIITDDPHGAYSDINAVWSRFQKYFMTMDGILSFRPSFEAYLTQALKEFMDDKVTYLEFRGTLPLLYELDGGQLSPMQTIQVYQDTVDAFVQQYGDTFYAARFIYAPPRGVSADVVAQYIELALAMKQQHPDLIAGFDLVGQEDLGPPLRAFIEPLLTLQDENTTLPVFYHAGETNWYGQDSDENIFDAFLLNASRIGHGYAIAKHPALLQRARDTQTPVEVCPVSNQVLMLVEDLRNHPAVGLVASNFPLVVSSDDPAAWGALPLSHDFYEAFMAFGGAKADLRLLKQLSLNSIQFSSLDESKKPELQAMWQSQWDNFIISTTEKLLNNNITVV